MSIFDEKPGAGPSAAAELASLEAEAGQAADPQPPEPQAPQEAAPGEAAAADPAAVPGDGTAGEDTRQVPFKALKEERGKRRALEQKLAAVHAQLQALMAEQPPAAPPPQPEVPPDPAQDPVGALRYERQQREQIQQHLQQQALEQQVLQDYQADAQRFAVQTPDFPQAYNHLVAGRVAELRAQGFGDDNIARVIRQEEFNIALGALRAGRSPAQQAYELARARGYVPPPAAGQSPLDPALAALKAKAATSISDGGAGPRTEPSLEEISRLSGPAFDTAFERYTRQQGRRSTLFRSQ